MISEFTNVLPLSKEELKKADRTALIRLALHFIKMKAIPGLSQCGESPSDSVYLLSFNLTATLCGRDLLR